ncbi:MAG: hypothetical protein EA352_09255 [Gemmatimonadales bacterium]|nr:MAG: hypothetical protein EA352_09255 [Gemmatimonadales bacterium]
MFPNPSEARHALADRPVARVAKMHGEGHPELRQLHERVEALAARLGAQMELEERDVFEPLRAGLCTGSGVRGELDQGNRVMAGLLRELRSLTGDFAAPEYACNTWRALFATLADLEDDLHLHIHLETHVLLPGLEEGEGARA